MADIIKFPETRKKENLNAVFVLLDVCQRMHDEEGYIYTSSELKQQAGGEYILTLVMYKPKPDDIPDIIA